MKFVACADTTFGSYTACLQKFFAEAIAMWIFPTHCSGRTTDPTLRQRNCSFGAAMIMAAGCVFLSNTALAQTTLPTLPTAPAPTQARLIEWDLPAQADAVPGAMIVDTQGDDQNRIWFVTRFEGHVYKVDFPSQLMRGKARWTSWSLSEAAIFTGGVRKLRASKDRRFVFVRTPTTLERIDTQNCVGSSPRTCKRTIWFDQPDGFDVSDLAVDDRNNVFSTHTPADNTSYVQRLTPGTASAADTTIARWSLVRGAAGPCVGAASNPCLAGITVHPTKQHLVYFTEESTNNIGELDTSMNKVRRWSLEGLKAASCGTLGPVAGPRQLNVDRYGKLWTVTTSGHLVSLDPSSNKMTAHQMPSEAGADPFGVAPDDDVVGYTNAQTDKVGMLIPRGKGCSVIPTPPEPAPQLCATNPESCKVATDDLTRATVTTGTVSPIGKTVDAVTSPNPDGTFIEAMLFSRGNDSKLPLGITPAKSKSQGTFFYAVGDSQVLIDRAGFVRFPLKERVKHPRDDDDRDDGCDCEDHWHDWHDHAHANDDDDDSIANEHDSPTAQENVARGDSTPLAAGATAVYSMTATPTTLALLAIAEADNPTAQIGIDVYNAAGMLIAQSPSALGIAVAQVALPPAGTYTWRVRNYGAAVNYTPTTIDRQPQAPLVLVP